MKENKFIFRVIYLTLSKFISFFLKKVEYPPAWVKYELYKKCMYYVELHKICALNDRNSILIAIAHLNFLREIIFRQVLFIQ